MAVAQSAGITDIGRKRKGNEDSFFIDDDLRLYIVSDGMGGRQAGEVASRLVTETLRERMKRFLEKNDARDMADYDDSLSTEGNYIIASIRHANNAVYQAAQDNEAYKGMGATVSAVLVSDETLIASNVGDSPIYLIRNGAIEDLFVPHTVMAEHQALAPKGAKKLGEQFKHMITRAMGIAETVEPDIFEIQYFEGDVLLICSDGLSDKVSTGEILALVSSAEPKKSCKALVNLANERGGDDNITIITLKIDKIDVEEDTAKPPKNQRPLLMVEYDTEDTSYKGTVREIDTEGMFIETQEPFDIGQELMLTVSDQNDQQTLMATGKIVDRKPSGIKIELGKLNVQQKKTIKSFKTVFNKS